MIWEFNKINITRKANMLMPYPQTNTPAFEEKTVLQILKIFLKSSLFSRRISF